MAALLHQLEAVDPFTPPASTSQSPAFMHHCDLLRLLTSGVLSWLSHSYSWVRRPPPAKDPLMVSTRLHLMWPELAGVPVLSSSGAIKLNFMAEN